ncbi:hypothetical protein JYB88_12015 [Shewanella cyperi]|uniref:FlgO domain-containing protein n=1 Tax=Shewanella cyperi TaxID=2814292 RepID=A0A974XIM0_9GAMM|nr:FlgO family outer membrane protein [Shewanella cyperi]QSX28979.1 hypothetical protein JYB88_12015 [Shewanella cyperi]
MNKSLIIATVLALLAPMAGQAESLPKESQYQAEGYPARGQVNVLAQQMVNELLLQNDGLLPEQPLLVATPVSVADFRGSNELAQQLQQGLMAALHARYFNVVDVNLGEAVRVTAQGDLLLSRDWQQLGQNIDVAHVLVSSMSLAKDGLVLNSRIVDTGNKRVVAASQAFVAPAHLTGYLAQSERVVSRDGLLYRYEQRGEDKVKVLGDRP